MMFASHTVDCIRMLTGADAGVDDDAWNKPIVFASMFRRYGVRSYVNVCYAGPTPDAVNAFGIWLVTVKICAGSLVRLFMFPRPAVPGFAPVFWY